MNDPLKRLFCIVGFDKLSHSVSKNILSIVIDHLNHKKNEEFYFAVILSRKHDGLKDSGKIAKNFDIQREANDEYLSDYGTFVTSNAPGMGKSFFIQKQVRFVQENPKDVNNNNQSLYSLLLTGNISDFKLKSLGDQLKIVEQNKQLDLHLKLSYFNSNQESDFMISAFLFKTIYLRMIE